MYIVDLFSRLWHKKNIGIIVFLILNTLLVMMLFRDPVIGLGVYALSLVIALSPVGEAILRFQQGCKPMARKEHKERLLPLFEDVYQKAKEKDPSLPDDVKLYISKDKSPNAFATGRKTICLNKGILDFRDEQIQAILAHEFGHLSKKDTDFILLVAIGNLIVTIVFLLYRAFILVFGVLLGMASRSLATVMITFFIDIVLAAAMWVWTKIGIMLVMQSSRKNEYEADAFAHSLGYGTGLIDSLDRLDEYDTSSSKGLWANLSASHPDTDLRVAALQELDDLTGKDPSVTMA
ncbi:UNVERIFIED_CONTAM: zinc metalloprotease HtpX [Halobacillus marinus]